MKISINNIQWSIGEVVGTDTLLVVNGRFCRGVCQYKECQIWLDKSLKTDCKMVTLRHELTHAFLNAHLLDSKNKYCEEEVCEFVAIYSPQINSIVDKYFKIKTEVKTNVAEE